jgi:uncharacterized protein
VIVVSDTSCLCYLALMGREHWLHELYGEVFIPPAVAAELAEGAVKQPEIQRVLDEPWLIVRTLQSDTETQKLQETLDIGEAQAIALYQELNADLLMVDDLKGRLVAQKMRLKQIGLLGFILAAKRAGLLKEPLRAEFEKLLALGFRANRLLVETLLKEVGE